MSNNLLYCDSQYNKNADIITDVSISAEVYINTNMEYKPCYLSQLSVHMHKINAISIFQTL